MSNPQYNETSEYRFPPQGSGTHDWGHMPQTKKKGGSKALSILLVTVLVIAVLLGLAEFGARTFAKDKLVEGMRQSATESGYEMPQDPDVSFGTSPLLLTLLTKNVGSVDITIPSSLDIAYQDGNKARPDVKGVPAMNIEARDIALSENEKDTTFGDLTLHTDLPKDLILAEIAEEQQQKRDGGEGVAGFLQGQVEVTDITPNEGNQELEFDLNNGLAKLRMQPVVNNGELTFDVKGAEVLGIFNLPETAVQGIQEMLNRQQGGKMDGNLKFQDVTVTQEGLKVHLHGTNVNVQELSSEMDNTTGSVAS